MATIRVQKNNNYVVLNNTALNDENLSFKAKGIFAYLMSKPDDWTCQVKDLQKHSKDGRDSIYNGLKELREHGYMIKQPIKNEKNVIIEWEEILFETPQEKAKEIYKKQINKKATSGKSVSGKKIKKATSGKSVSGKSVYGKPVSIINTNLLSTDLLSIDTSSSNNINLNVQFEIDICKLRKTTKIKFEKLQLKYDKEFIKAVIEECSVSSVNSYSGFQSAFNSYLTRGCKTAEDVHNEANKFRKERLNKSIKNKINDKKGTFNNYEQRNYDFNELERKLLGWDK